MSSNRKDEFEDHLSDEESEYHFSEDEINYEMDQDAPKAPALGGFKDNLLNQLKKSKRLLIGLGAFFLLVFIVYKVVTPSSPPAAIITQVAEPKQQAMTNARPQAAPQALQQNPMAVNNQTATTMPVAPAPVTAPTTTTNQPMPSSSMPTMLPVNPPAAAYPNLQTNAGVETRVAELAANHDKLAAQLQTEYSQKLTDIGAQNTALQSQLQTLNTRVANLEAQLTQLAQALTQQNNKSVSNQGMPAQTQTQAAPQPKIPYNVQAIIPGRAWLRSESGETVTVAEGDTIKDLGRVTKIDPYDGIVEINTGNKVISLSYGAGS